MFILLFRRRSAIPLLLGWSVFHVVVLSLSGICFWQWLMIDGVVALVLWRFPGLLVLPPFPKIQAAASMFLIGTSVLWLHIVPLYWIDTPLIYTYRIEGDGESGRSYNLPTSLFGPHDFELKLMGFGYLIPPDQPALARKSHTAELALTLQPIFADASSISLHFFHCKLRLSSPFSTEFHFPFSPLPP